MPIDEASLPCQHCENTIVFSDVSKVTDAQCKKLFSTLGRDGGLPQHILDSYVDVEQPRTDDGGRRHKGGLASFSEILELASAHNRVDHPICAKCLESIIGELKKKTSAVESQAKAYDDALRSLRGSFTGPPLDESLEDASIFKHQSFRLTAEQLKKHLEIAEREAEVEKERTIRLEKELNLAQLDLEDIKKQEQALDHEEAEFWGDCDTLWLNLYDHLEEVDAVGARVKVAARQLDSLRQSSVLESCFHIWYKDRFGTISGFRLGRYKDEVKWSEVNAAWGQAILLLDMMTRMYPEFKWEGGVLKPMASHSMISDGKEDYKLHGPVNRVWSGRFDNAMCLYLQCLECFATFARDKDIRLKRRPLTLPNPIDSEKGTVRGLSIRYGNMLGNENWNKVLKFMLVDLKFLLHWVTTDKGLVEAGSSEVPREMMTDSEGEGRAQRSNPLNLAASTFVPRTMLGGGADRGAQSMMQTSSSDHVRSLW